MSESTISAKLEESPSGDARSMLNSVINAGKAAVHKVDREQLLALIQNQPGISGPVAIDNLRGSGEVGASSGIVIFTATYDAGSGAVTRDLVLRHAPGSETRLFFEYDMARQFQVQRALQGSVAPVPEPLWLDHDGRHLGVPGYVMVAARGVAPHPSAFLKGPIAEASPQDRERMLDQIMRSMVAIHRTDIHRAGLTHFVMNAPGNTAMQRCINWYWQTWDWVQLPNYQRLVPVHRWLLDHLPEGESELMHGDCTLHNYLFDGSTLTGVLDWEMSSLGRAEADLALQCVANTLFAAPADSGLPLPPGEAEWLARYRDAGGRAVRDFDYFKKFAAYMIVVAVSALQRNLPEAARLAQEPLLRPCWALLEA
jgi:aminoglycoside phosphotransferase (APT) family kinase protein